MPDIIQPFFFEDLGPRKVQADFSGGHLTSDGGVLFLRQINRGLGLTRGLAQCFYDLRHQDYVDHSVEQLLDQRLYGLSLGHEDLNDHNKLRLDPLLAVACEKSDPLGMDRVRPEHRGVALAGASTLNRLELSNSKDTAAHKLRHDPAKIESCLMEMGARCLPKNAREVVLDLDAMGHRIHGMQEGRHFNAYYDDYCYLPLYIFAGDIPLLAQLRTCEHSVAHGVVPSLEKIVATIRKRCPKAKIIIRGDSGFGVDEIMTWCESQLDVFYCLGIGKHSGLLDKLAPALAAARARHCLTGGVSTRVFAEFDYQTKTSWSCQRRVIGKAEVMAGGDNPRFIVTNLPNDGFKEDPDRERFTPARLYEQLYCARGEMENVLKQQVLDLEGDRVSTHYMASNQLRLWFTTFAYMLMERMRTIGCHGTELARATAGTLRLKLLKVAAQVKVSVRRVHIKLNSAYPFQNLFALCRKRLSAMADPAG
jgi:hypothetical protein